MRSRRRHDLVSPAHQPAALPALDAGQLAVQLALVRLAEEELPLGVAYQRFLDTVHRVIAFDHGTLYITEWSTGRLVPVAVRGNRIELAERVPFARGHGLSAWVAQEGRPVVIPDPHVRTERSPFQDRGLRAFLAFPLVQQGVVAGVLALARGEREVTPEEYAALACASEALAACLGQLRRTARLRELVRQDPETGRRPDRSFLARVDEALQRSRQHGVAFAVAVLDLEGAHGRWPVDEAIARCLAEAMRSCDVAAPLGAGRWGLLLAGVDADRAALIVARIVRAFGAGAPGRVRTGIADGRGARSAREILDRAAAALEAAV